uniref:DDE Tnp4 domain-containing protein n=1 Tax=Scophthalmus maximus TaxID=52904 RepID=A0A8D3ALE2_SCOMX
MRDFARLFPDQFRAREELVSPLYRSKTTNYRDRISVGERLAVTLRFLATGERSFKTLCYQFRMGASTIRQFVPETCAAVYQVLEDTYMKVPSSGWIPGRWNFPNCLGALDPTRNRIHTSQGRTHTLSVVLMALVDSCYRFLCVDVGRSGRIADGRAFGGRSLQEGEQVIPHPCTRTAFPLTDVLASRFRVFLTTINIQDPAKVEDIVLACCALHNFLRTESEDGDKPPYHTQPMLHHEPSSTGTNYAATFLSECGTVPFQWDKT